MPAEGGRSTGANDVFGTMRNRAGERALRGPSGPSSAAGMGTGAGRQLARFGTVGLAAAAVHYGTLVAVVESGLAPAAANGLAFLVALSVTFLGQSLWAFAGAAPMGAARRLGRFAAAAATGLAANAALMALAVGAGLPYRAGFVLCLLVVPALSFALARLWVFAPHVRVG